VTIIIKPPVAGLSMQDLLTTLDAMRQPGEEPIRTGSGGFVVGEALALRFLAALADTRQPPAAVADVTTWDPTIPPHPPPAPAQEPPVELSPTPAAEPVQTPEPESSPAPTTRRKTPTARTRRTPR
jgi:outer membrane biosynthesis protein TonB